jgi:hypothetical protein
MRRQCARSASPSLQKKWNIDTMAETRNRTPFLTRVGNGKSLAGSEMLLPGTAMQESKGFKRDRLLLKGHLHHGTDPFEAKIGFQFAGCFTRPFVHLL